MRLLVDINIPKTSITMTDRIIVVKTSTDTYSVICCKYDTFTYDRDDKGDTYGTVYTKLSERAQEVVDAIHDEYGDEYHGSLNDLKNIISSKLTNIRMMRRSINKPIKPQPHKPSKTRLEPYDIETYCE